MLLRVYLCLEIICISTSVTLNRSLLFHDEKRRKTKLFTLDKVLTNCETRRFSPAMNN